jgi:hypothetical protein
VKSIYFVFFCLILIGCSDKTAQHVTHRVKSQYGPTDAVPGGMVRYSNEGSDSDINRRREDAYKKMFDACDGKYKITSEHVSAEVAMIGRVPYNYKYVYIDYDCIGKF